MSAIACHMSHAARGMRQAYTSGIVCFNCFLLVCLLLTNVHLIYAVAFALLEDLKCLPALKAIPMTGHARQPRVKAPIKAKAPPPWNTIFWQLVKFEAKNFCFITNFSSALQRTRRNFSLVIMGRQGRKLRGAVCRTHWVKLLTPQLPRFF